MRLLTVIVFAGAAGGLLAAPAIVHSDQGACNNNTFSGNIPGTCGAAVTSRTSTYTPNTSGNAVLVFVTCAATSGTVTAVSLTASGWTFTQVGGISGNTSNGFAAVFRAYAPNTSAATLTQSWTASGGTCGNFMNDLVGEFSGTDLTNFVDGNNAATGSGTPTVSVTPTGNNDLIWAAADDTVTAVGNIAGSAATKGADDTNGDWSESRLISGGAGSPQSSAFTGSGGYTIFAIAIKAPSATTTNEYFTEVMNAANRFFDRIGILVYRKRRDYLCSYIKSLPKRGALRWLEDIKNSQILRDIADADITGILTGSPQNTVLVEKVYVYV